MIFHYHYTIYSQAFFINDSFYKRNAGLLFRGKSTDNAAAKDLFCRKDNPRLSENYNPIICVEPKGKGAEEWGSLHNNSISESVRELPPGEY